MNKTKLSVLGILVGVTIGVGGYFIYKSHKKKQPVKREDPVFSSPEDLIEKIARDLIENPDTWNNERDFLDKITSRYIKYVWEKKSSCSSIWLEELPVSQDRMFNLLDKLGLLSEFEKELEEKYVF